MKKRVCSLLLVAVLLVSMLSVTAFAAGTTSLFTDVATTDWYYEAVTYVNEAGLMTGVGMGFAPNAATTRAQLWAILARLDGESLDRNTADWYAGYQHWAIRNNISDGTNPNGEINREQLASMLYRFATHKGLVRGAIWTDLSVFSDAQSVSDYALEAMQWAVSSGLINGMGGKLNPQGTATRAQVAALLQRICKTWDILPQDSLNAIWAGTYAGLTQTPNQDHEGEDHTYTYTYNGNCTHIGVCRCGDTLAVEECDLIDGVCTLCGEKNGWNGVAATEEELLAVKSTWVYNKNEETGVETLGDLYTIDTPNLLAAYANYVNEGNSNYKDKVVLDADINLGGWNWTPIGTEEHPFTGRVVDGQGHTVSYLRCNGGVDGHTDLEAVNQGLFGVTYTNGNIVEIMNLNLHNVNIYAKNSAGALIGCLDTAQSVYWLAGYTGIHDIALTGNVTIEGGSSGGISGSPVAHWALQTGFSRITIEVNDGSYLSNVAARELSGDGVGGALGGVVAVAAWDRGSIDIVSNLDVIGVAGNVGGVVGVGNQVWYRITCSGDVTVKGVTPAKDGKYNYGLAIGGFAPVWHHTDMSAARRETVVATGTLTLELTDGTVVYTNGQASDAIGGFFW